MDKDTIYEALTIQALQMRNEIYQGDTMDRDTFDGAYLNGIGEYERKIAKQEDIEIEN